MPFISNEADTSSALPGIGLALRVDQRQSHIGVIYNREGKIYICHLAWHFAFRNEPFSGADYHWSACSSFITDEDNTIYLQARLATLTPELKIPYGFEFPPGKITESIEASDMPVGGGLTCATFVLALFESQGYNLIDYDSWKVRDEDVEWQAKIIQMVEISDRTQAEAMKAYIGAFRYRPEEVAAAGTSDDAPLEFEAAVRQGEALRMHILVGRDTVSLGASGCQTEDDESRTPAPGP